MGKLGGESGCPLLTLPPVLVPTAPCWKHSQWNRDLTANRGPWGDVHKRAWGCSWEGGVSLPSYSCSSKGLWKGLEQPREEAQPWEEQTRQEQTRQEQSPHKGGRWSILEADSDSELSPMGTQPWNFILLQTFDEGLLCSRHRAFTQFIDWVLVTTLQGCLHFKIRNLRLKDVQ